MAIEVVQVKDHPTLAPTYSHIAITDIKPRSRLAVISGQVGIDVDNPESKPDLQSQIRRAFANLDKCLAAIGANKSDVLLTRQYIVKMSEVSKEDFDARTRIYIEWLEGTPPPAETLVGSHSQADGILFEVEAVVILN